jgi:hypothetical protein
VDAPASGISLIAALWRIRNICTPFTLGRSQTLLQHA